MTILKSRIQAIQEAYKQYYEPLLEQRPEYWYQIYQTTGPPLGPFKEWVQELGYGTEPVETIITATLAGHGVHEHTDSTRPPFYDRWHLPIHTDGTILVEDGTEILMVEGQWQGPIRYWLPHSVQPTTNINRVHFIVNFPAKKGGCQ